MQTPAIPPDEQERLADLRAMNLLDTPPEGRFDRIVELAAAVFDVPMAYVSLIEADRQWMKARCGVDVEETGRDISFCGHTILSSDPLIVPDALLDERFHDNPLVVNEPYVRFYAGWPLKGPAGKRVGVLCISDSQPRKSAVVDRNVLERLAQLVEHEFGLVGLVETQQELAKTQAELRRVYESAVRTYVGERVASGLACSEAKEIEPTRMDVTILFSDICGFTTYCEDRDPDDVVSGLNQYLGELVNRVTAYGGHVNKFVGDGLLAVFSDEDDAEPGTHAQRALDCARSLLSYDSSFRTRVGIHTGPAVLGNVGCEVKREYTVLGDTVNLASRLEELNKSYETGVLMSSETANRVNGSAEVRPLGEAEVRGRSGKLEVFTLAN